MRTVLAVDSFGANPVTGEEILIVKAERAPIEVPEAKRYQPFIHSPKAQPPWDTKDAVLHRGRMLRVALRNHPGLATILDHLAAGLPGQVQPIFIKLSDGDAELFTWESLCDQSDSFLALDQRWPIGRISDPLNGQSRPPAVLRMPLKVMAVISAFGIPGQKEEWKMIRKAAEAARDAQFGIRLRLLVGDEETRAEVEAAIAGGLDWVEVSHIEKTAPRVIQDIIDWAPNVLHFFCHGSAGSTPADQALELATATDYLNPQAQGGSVKIRAQQLSTMSQELTNPMLLTLNCCSGGQAAKELHSIAYQVVAAGFPAAVAMVEPVAADDAHEFTRAFYSKVFADLKKATAALKGAPQVPFEWAQTLHDVRMAICALHPVDGIKAREWTLPALYVRGVDPHFFGRPAPEAAETPEAGRAAFKLSARLVAEWLLTVRDKTTEESRLEVMQDTLAGVPKNYWPNVDGTFSQG